MMPASKILSLRAAVAAAVVASAAAAGVASSRTSTRPVEAGSRNIPTLVSPPSRDSPRPPTRWTDGSSGRTHLMPPPNGMLLEFGVCSPWRDGTGRFQVAGRLSGENTGLAQVSFPDGAVLDFVETGGALVASRPCWYPGTRPRVLYAAGDGCLYRCDFRDETTGLASEAPDGRPSRIGWTAPSMPTPEAYLSDPCWPREPRFDRVLLVVVASRINLDGQPRPAHDRLWWVRLDEAGEAVIEAGPVFESPTVSGGGFLRSPVVATAADGGVVLAYLSTDRPREGRWELRAARLAFDHSGRLEAPTQPADRLSECCSTDLPPSFNADATEVTILQADPGGGRRLLHVSLPTGGVVRAAAVSSFPGRTSDDCQ